jgi:hypothetical protein
MSSNAHTDYYLPLHIYLKSAKKYFVFLHGHMGITKIIALLKPSTLEAHWS